MVPQREGDEAFERGAPFDGKDEFAMLRKEFDKVQILTPASASE